MEPTIEEKVIYRLLRDPMDAAAKAQIDKWEKAGRFKLEDVRLNSDDAYEQLNRSNRVLDMMRRAEQERERAEKAKRAAEKALAEAKAVKNRNVFRRDDRQLEWRYIVSLALKTDLIRHDDEGAKIAWRYRRWAIEVFTSHLWQWREVTPALLREITLRWWKGGGFLPDIEDLLLPLGVRSTRAGPTQQNWQEVRDRLEL